MPRNRKRQRESRMAVAKRESIRNWVFVGGGVGAVIAVIVVGIILISGDPSGPGQEISSLGVQHLEVGQTYPNYNSNPPTSGPHSPSRTPRGFYSQGTPDEGLVHSLEHGYVVINHNCNDSVCPELVDDLARIFTRYDEKLIVNYRPETQSTIALTAWTRLLTMEEHDEELIVDFIDSYRGKIGPERNVP